MLSSYVHRTSDHARHFYLTNHQINGGTINWSLDPAPGGANANTIEHLAILLAGSTTYLFGCGKSSNINNSYFMRLRLHGATRPTDADDEY